MAEIYQATAPLLTNVSKSTRLLVVAYHFLVAVFLVGAIVLAWMGARFAPEYTLIAEVVTAIAVPFAALYLIVGWGIFEWKNWSRTASLVLNWINVAAAVLNVARFRMNPDGVLGVLISCAVLWWLSTSAVRLKFCAGSKA